MPVRIGPRAAFHPGCSKIIQRGLLPGLRGVKGYPRLPGAFVVLFFGPELRFNVSPIRRRASVFAEVTDRLERVINPARLFLRAIKLIPDCIIIGRAAKLAFQFDE